MRLSEFIRQNTPEIMARWEDYAREFLPPEQAIDKSSLRDNIAAFLKLLEERLDKAQHPPSDSATSCGDAAQVHAEHRFLSGFDSLEVLSEFVALRERLLNSWLGDRVPDKDEIVDVRNFNRVMDELISEALTKYSETETKARTLFLGTLIHDLKNPLNAISQAAQTLPAVGGLNDKQKHLACQIGKSSARINELVTALIDATRFRLGKGMPLNCALIGLGDIARDAIEELRSAYPHKEIRLSIEGDTSGYWDPVRCAEVVSNLTANAIQHGDEAPVEVRVTGSGEEVMIAVHNKGEPIPPEALVHIFDPLKSPPPKAKADKMSLGLGLFIARAVMMAHGGALSVTSTAEAGTTFCASFPRSGAGQHAGAASVH